MLSFANAEEVREYCEEQSIEFVAFYLSDIDGRLRNVIIPSENFSKRTIEEGIGFDASNFGFATVDKSDMVLRPDLDFAFVDPLEARADTLNFFCHMVEVESFDPFDQDPRHIVAKALAALAAEGIADGAAIGLELEFFVLDELFSTMTPRETSFRLESSEMANPPGGQELYRIYKKRGYFRAEPNDQLVQIRNQIVMAFKRLGIPVKYHHHEVASAQAEIEFEFMPIERMADVTVLAKHICHRVARENGKVISFIPKLIPGEAGNGMHVHHYLLKDGVNVFNDEAGLYKLSGTALSYLAGVLQHASSLLALTNPTTNSYRRLIPGLEAPVKAVFAMGNRSAAIRIPGYVRDPQHRRFEFRTIDATCNPYLAYGAMMMAGLDGVRSRLDPTAEGFGPFGTNLYELPAEDLARIQSFPSSLEHALTALEQDMDYLLYRDVFPQALLEKWTAAKMTDIHDMRAVPHPWEIARYYDI